MCVRHACVMAKDFVMWNQQKKRMNSVSGNRLYNEREVWWCSLGINIGFEQDGTGNNAERPILILKGISRETCFALPLTTSSKKNRYRISLGDIGGRNASAICSQLKVIDTRRFINKICRVDEDIFLKIRKAVRSMF